MRAAAAKGQVRGKVGSTGILGRMEGEGKHPLSQGYNALILAQLKNH